MHPTIPMLLVVTALAGSGAGQAAPQPAESVAATRPFTAEELDRLAADHRQRAEASRRQAADLRTAEEQEIRQIPSSPKAPPNPWIQKTRERYATLIEDAERQAAEAIATATYFTNRALERRLEAQHP